MAQKAKYDGLQSFNVRRIPVTGIPLGIQANTPGLSESIQEMLGCELLEIDAPIRIQSNNGLLKLHGQLSVSLGLYCARCGSEICWNSSSAMTMLYAPDPGGKNLRTEKQLEKIQMEVELENEDLDIGWYQDGRISILDAIAEYLFMQIPSTIRCEMEGVIRKTEGECILPMQ